MELVETQCNDEIPAYTIDYPWPTIILLLVGGSLTMIAAGDPNLDNSKRIFTMILIIFWVIIWSIILMILWRENHRIESWWWLLIPITVIVLCFVLLVVINIQ